MRIQPGDPDKQSLKDRGLTWEMILQAIESGGLLDVLTGFSFPQTSKNLPPMKYNVKKSLSVPLSPEEQQLEDRLTLAKSSATPKEMEAIRQAATKALQSFRGGSRLGAGRKPRPHIRTTLLLAPEVRSKLERLARQHGSLSLAAEVVIRKAKTA